MATSISTMTPVGPSRVPFDLRLWINARRLVGLTLEATTEINEASIDLPGFNLGNIDHRPRVLLALLTYCYATGTLASQEVERRIDTDDAVRYLAANGHPDSGDLRVFRRRWKHLIKQCLVNLLILAWRARSIVTADSDEQRAGSSRDLAEQAVPAELLRHFVSEADQRIYQAVQLDSMDLDF